ncbi:acyl-CoA dehydrogenase NM domain-like protein [Flagelloscypha sp. PMI_526]|nr:acyl-CoA dehydrogenase NM domain-like protein [Flagelloscypha sp. PMI_526]
MATTESVELILPIPSAKTTTPSIPPWSDSPWKIPASALSLRTKPVFRLKPSEFFESYLDRSAIALERARQFVRSYNLTVEDVVQLRDPFWALHSDVLFSQDGAAGTLSTIQVNLAAGTIGQFVEAQPTLRPLIQQILKFDVLAHYLLTEVGHGLDAINCETTATSNEEGGFTLHTPTPNGAKFMPPTAPIGMPSVAVVFAQLTHNGKHLGLRAFVVPMSNGKLMAKGITSRLLPARGSSAPVHHSITSFDNVQLPHEALLGALEAPEGGKEALRAQFLQVIYRAAVGALALAAPSISALEKCVYVAGRYSQRRTVGAPGHQVPIVSFRTQHQPIILSIAQIAVFKQLMRTAVHVMQDLNEDPRVRHAYATIAKAAITHACLTSVFDLSERCGARGVFESNGFVSSHANIRGLCIAEGDVLVLCLRLASELLLGRYDVHPSDNRTSILTMHEESLFDIARRNVLSTPSRGDGFSRHILPQCENLIRSIGYRMAYDAALMANVDPLLVDVFHSWAVRMDSAWYSEHAGFNVEAQRAAESSAIEAAYPKLDHWLSTSATAQFATDNPLVSGEAWDSLVDTLPVYNDTFRARL